MRADYHLGKHYMGELYLPLFYSNVVKAHMKMYKIIHLDMNWKSCKKICITNNLHIKAVGCEKVNDKWLIFFSWKINTTQVSHCVWLILVPDQFNTVYTIKILYKYKISKYATLSNGICSDWTFQFILKVLTFYHDIKDKKKLKKKSYKNDESIIKENDHMGDFK